jgi:hypothetical protein
MAVRAQGLKVGGVVVRMITVDVVDIDLAGMFRLEATASAGGWRAKGTHERDAMFRFDAAPARAEPGVWDSRGERAARKTVRAVA